jgi:hypothetical protein
MKPFTDRDPLSVRSFEIIFAAECSRCLTTPILSRPIVSSQHHFKYEVIERDIFRKSSARFPQHSLEYEMVPANGQKQQDSIVKSPAVRFIKQDSISCLGSEVKLQFRLASKFWRHWPVLNSSNALVDLNQGMADFGLFHIGLPH